MQLPAVLAEEEVTQAKLQVTSAPDQISSTLSHIVRQMDVLTQTMSIIEVHPSNSRAVSQSTKTASLKLPAASKLIQHPTLPNRYPHSTTTTVVKNRASSSHTRNEPRHSRPSLLLRALKSHDTLRLLSRTLLQSRKTIRLNARRAMQSLRMMHRRLASSLWRWISLLVNE
jgi:hypothetical protein